MGRRPPAASRPAIIAALRSIPGAHVTSPREVKSALLSSARQPNGTPDAWNPQTGHGIIDAEAAASALLSTR